MIPGEKKALQNHEIYAYRYHWSFGIESASIEQDDPFILR